MIKDYPGRDAARALYSGLDTASLVALLGILKDGGLEAWAIIADLATAADDKDLTSQELAEVRRFRDANAQLYERLLDRQSFAVEELVRRGVLPALPAGDLIPDCLPAPQMPFNYYGTPT